MLQAKYKWIKSNNKWKKKRKKGEGNIEATYLCLGYQIIHEARTGCFPLRIPPLGMLSNWGRTVNLVNENNCGGQIISTFSLCFFWLLKIRSEGNKEPNWKGHNINKAQLWCKALHIIFCGKHLQLYQCSKFSLLSTTHLKIKYRATNQSTCLLRATTLQVVFLLPNVNQTLSWNVGTA